jgi:hypothetical protein
VTGHGFSLDTSDKIYTCLNPSPPLGHTTPNCKLSLRHDELSNSTGCGVCKETYIRKAGAVVDSKTPYSCVKDEGNINPRKINFSLGNIEVCN